jgi:DNA-binding transcriptional MerR regulator/methanogenic corrinoid protein MtbC1
MFEDYSDEPIYNVKAVAIQSGVEASTLRAWERRYGVPQPPRSDSGYRLYSARDTAIIRWLKQQIESGMNISQAVSMLRSIQAGRQAPQHHANYHNNHVNHVNHNNHIAQTLDDIVPHSNGTAKHLEQFDRYVSVAFNCALAFDEAGFEHVLSDAFALYSVEDVCARVIQPLLVMIGAGWHKGTVTISAEHFASNLVRRKLIALMAACPSPTDHRKIVTGCAPEEFHEIGVLMLSLYLRRRGKDVIFLGQATASNRLGEMLMQTEPRLVLMSASTLRTAANLMDIVDVLSDRRFAPVLFAYGGPIFQRLPTLAKRLSGIHISEDVSQAIDQIDALLNAGESFVQRGGRASTEAKQALNDFKLSCAQMAADMMAGMRQQPAFNYDHVALSSEYFAHAIESALRLDAPELLAHPIAWQWQPRPPDGPSVLQLQQHLGILAQAVQQRVPLLSRHIVSQCVAYLIESVRLNKD